MIAVRPGVSAAALAAALASSVPGVLACGGPPPDLWTYVRQRALIAVAVVTDVSPVPPPLREEAEAGDDAEAGIDGDADVGVEIDEQRVTVRLVEVWSGDAALTGRSISFIGDDAVSSSFFVLIAAEYEGDWFPLQRLGPVDARARRELAKVFRRGLDLLPPRQEEPRDEAESEEAEFDEDDLAADPDAAALVDWLVDACAVPVVRQLALLGLKYERDPADRRRPLSGMLLFSHQQRLAGLLLDHAADAPASSPPASAPAAETPSLTPRSFATLLDLLETYPSALVDRAAVRTMEAFLTDPAMADEASDVVGRVLRRLGQGERAAALDWVWPRDPDEWDAARARHVALVRNRWEAARRELAAAAPFTWGP